ncbi:very short patch repair endonuclease [Thermus brockianus]
MERSKRTAPVLPKTSSKAMSRVKATNTTPERVLRKALWQAGIRGYKIHTNIFGKPDLCFTKKRVVVFVDGCFWHGCPICYRKPFSNADYWERKVARNQKRDRAVTEALQSDGWKVLRVWEHEVKNNLTHVVQTIKELLK